MSQDHAISANPLDPTGNAHPSSRFASEEEEPSVDLAAAAQSLWSGRVTILKVSLVTLLVAAAVAFLLPAQFTSTASFIPPNAGSGNSLASVIAGQVAGAGAADLLSAGKTSGELYSGILKSRSVLAQLVKQFDLQRVYKVRKESQAEARLDANTAVQVNAKSSIVALSVTDPSPALAHDLANAYLQALVETEGRLALGQSSQRRLFFERQLVKEKDDLENAEVDLKRTEEQSGLIAPAGQTESEIKTIADTQGQLAAREVRLASLRQSATSENSEVIRLESEIADLRGQLSRLQTGSGRASPTSIPTSKVPQVQLEYIRKEREVKYHETLFEALSKQYEAAHLDEEHDAPVLQVLDSASYPDSKSSPKRLLIMLAGFAAGLLGGCLWVILRAYRQGLLTSSRAV